MARLTAFIYGSLAYLLFLGTFLYAIGFVAGLVVPKGIDDGVVTSTPLAIAINAGLMCLFAVQHSVMARPWFKERWTRIVPQPIERSTFVVATCIAMGLMFWLWRPLPEAVWHAEASWARGAIWALCALGWGTVLYATCLIDHFDLFGLRQVVLHLKNAPYEHRPFIERSLYKLVRHPLLLGFIIAFWAAPTMSQGHLLFALVTTGYMLVAIQLEERDLVRHLGQKYIDYRRRTSMILPVPKRDPSAQGSPGATPVRS